ncbi:hypothetical protein M434DRAFT_12067 [Hypoxylon sp. CO27-5]|nr:hypothetical protein M434DRAFT_12067 [Hypoxylon sp. CO27-5]
MPCGRTCLDRRSHSGSCSLPRPDTQLVRKHGWRYTTHGAHLAFRDDGPGTYDMIWTEQSQLPQLRLRDVGQDLTISETILVCLIYRLHDTCCAAAISVLHSYTQLTRDRRLLQGGYIVSYILPEFLLTPTCFINPSSHSFSLSVFHVYNQKANTLGCLRVHHGIDPQVQLDVQAQQPIPVTGMTTGINNRTGERPARWEINAPQAEGGL